MRISIVSISLAFALAAGWQNVLGVEISINDWLTAVDGSFSEPANWTLNTVPNESHHIYFRAHIPDPPPPYAVNFTENIANGALYVESNNVTFDLGGFTHIIAPLDIGDGVITEGRVNIAGEIAANGNLTITNGTAAYRSVSVAEPWDAFGIFNISGAHLVADSLSVAENGRYGLLFIDDNATAEIGGAVNVGPGGEVFVVDALLHLTGIEPITLNGRLRGSGLVQAHVDNVGGIVNPAADPDAPQPRTAILQIDGNYSQHNTGMLTIDLAGAIPGDEHDRLAVSGAASLDGALHVALANDFVPQNTDSFVILTATAASGTFANCAARHKVSGRVRPLRYRVYSHGRHVEQLRPAAGLSLDQSRQRHFQQCGVLGSIRAAGTARQVYFRSKRRVCRRFRRRSHQQPLAGRCRRCNAELK